MHYLVIFASFTTNCFRGYRVKLLTFSPLSDDCRLDSDEHVDFIKFILNYYGKSLSNVTCVIGDNCNVKKSSNKLSKPLIGCASHRFNLAVYDIISSDRDIIDKIQDLMFKLRSLLLSAKLRQFTP